MVIFACQNIRLDLSASVSVVTKIIPTKITTGATSMASLFRFSELGSRVDQFLLFSETDHDETSFFFVDKSV